MLESLKASLISLVHPLSFSLPIVELKAITKVFFAPTYRPARIALMVFPDPTPLKLAYRLYCNKR